MLPRLMLVMVMAAALPACVTHAYLPSDGQLLSTVAAPAELRQVAGTAATKDFYRPTQLPGSSAGDQAEGLVRREASGWFAGPGQDYRVEISNGAVGKETGFWTMVLYFGSLGALPVTTSQEYESTLVVKNSAGDE